MAEDERIQKELFGQEEPRKCTRCPRLVNDQRYKMCGHCRAKTTAQASQRVARLKSAALCRICMSPCSPGSQQCKECLAKTEAKNNAMIAAGICPACGGVLDDLARQRCSACRARATAAAKKSKGRQTPRYKAIVRASRDRLKDEVFRHYSPDCVCQRCGFADIRALHLDHINGDGNHRLTGCSGNALYFKVKREGFPEGFQVLCANCNLIKQHEKGEWSGKNKKHAP